MAHRYFGNIIIFIVNIVINEPANDQKQVFFCLKGKEKTRAMTLLVLHWKHLHTSVHLKR